MRTGYLMLLAASAACEVAPTRTIAVERAPTAETVSAPMSADVPPPMDAAPPPVSVAGRKLDVADRVELTFMGDIMFGGTFNGSWMPSDVPQHDPLERVAPLLKSDLALANLETTVLSEIPRLKGNLRFVATPEQVATLPRNGLMAVTLANNHANDAGAAGVDETSDHLSDLGMTVIGEARDDDSGYPVETVDVRGWKIGFIAATTKLNRKQRLEKKADRPATIPWLEADDLRDTLLPVISDAKDDHDLVIVVLHWGEQYDDVPATWQVAAAHAFIDAGASAVVGHHPHVLQGIERYGDGVIAYSLGNFLFQNASPGSRSTGVLRLGFSRRQRCLDQLVFHPAVMRVGEIYYPDAPKPRELDVVGERIIGLSGSEKLKTTWRLDGDAFVADAACAPATELARGPTPK